MNEGRKEETKKERKQERKGKIPKTDRKKQRKIYVMKYRTKRIKRKILKRKTKASIQPAAIPTCRKPLVLYYHLPPRTGNTGYYIIAINASSIIAGIPIDIVWLLGSWGTDSFYK
jgi:hypothetical protein